ncbi:DUF5696 domain-containing protein [Thermogutta sp.]|uniref:DUF5696 domain-containing protein n=1 Tax=Thermogutta sp. TaxID=1962930 RepID=UPI003C7DC3AA
MRSAPILMTRRCGKRMLLFGGAFSLALFLAVGLSSKVIAYNPPVDSALGVTLRIEGPSEVTYSPEGFECALVVQNTADRPLRGAIRLLSIDQCQAEPGEIQDLVVPPGETARRSFRLQFGPRVYNAHYPIHAYGRFELDGHEVLLHPILVFLVRGAPATPTAEWDWKPLEFPKNTALALEEVPVFRAVFQVFGQNPETMPVGWQGSHPSHRGTCDRMTRDLGGVAKPVIGIHPPWYQGQTGTGMVEFPVALPAGAPIRLSFALGMTPEGQSDGVTFRVRVAELSAPDGEFGDIVFERHTTAKTWEQHEVDLSAYAGKTIRLQLESHPGPKNNTGWDSSFWAEPTLIAGTIPTAREGEPSKPGTPIILGMVGLGGLRGQAEIELGSRGLLDANVRFRFAQRVLSFRGFEVTVFGSRLDRVRSATALLGVESRVEKSSDGGQQLVVKHRFKNPAGPFDLIGTVGTEKGTLVISWRLDDVPPPRPWVDVHIEDVALGSWSQEAFRVYAGPGNVVQKPQSYSLGFDGHRLSTSFVGLEFDGGLSVVQGCDVPPSTFQVNPAARHYSLHVAHASKMTLIPATRVWEAVKQWREVNGLKPSDGVSVLAGRFVFDLWGGYYRDSAEALRKAFRYGLTDSLVIWHNWQRWGYDYRLPEIFPPNPSLGTLEDMQYLAQTCRQAGVLFALHDNYIDFYPDAEGFSYLDTIAFHANGQPVRAWFNEGRQAQSYRYRADRVAPFLQANLAKIAEYIKPTAYFIDVWSSIDPYDYWTADGKFFDKVYTRNTWGQHFAWIRQLLGDHAPQISESGHDQLIGWLDGATTNHLRVGKPIPGYYQWSVWNWECEDAERVPWFDAAHHDRFVLHGAGYSGRYQAGLDARLHGIYSDDYITTEVLTGHPAMVAQPFGQDVIRKYWLLSALGRALALDRIEDVEFVDGDIHRIHVKWSSGVETWCNRGDSDWEVAGVVLPQFGFLARPADNSQAGSVVKEVAIARRDGLIVEWAVTPQSIYVNGRKDYMGPEPIRPRATKYAQKGQEIEIAVDWAAHVPILPGWVPFAHFCDEKGDIIFQGQFEPRDLSGVTGQINTIVRASIPSSVPAGQELELRVGVYRPRDGRRLSLAGPDDGQSRIRLGKIRRAENNQVTWTPQPDEPDRLLLRKNPEGRPVNFQGIMTAQGVRVSQMDDGVLVVPLPLEDQPTELTIFWTKLPWKLAVPGKAEFLEIDGKVLRTERLSGQVEIKLVIQPGEWAARLVP